MGTVVGQVSRFAEAVTMPWLGGGGITHELARFPPTGDFDWRLSVAEVERDGAFSQLFDIDRVIVLCSAGRMILQGSNTHELQRFSPYSFDGGDAINCTVPDGPTRDFNVMTRRGMYAADVVTVQSDIARVEAVPTAHTFAVCLDGMVTCQATGTEEVELAIFDMTRLESGRYVSVNARAGAVAIVTLSTANS